MDGVIVMGHHKSCMYACMMEWSVQTRLGCMDRMEAPKWREKDVLCFIMHFQDGELGNGVGKVSY